MPKNNKKNKKKSVAKTSLENENYPFVSICTPTFNRRPFYDMLIRCFHNQTYPKDRMEWVIIDDGSDKIRDLVENIPQVKYYAYDQKMNLGKKRNLMHEKSKGDIILYMDDDDYYPPERVSHAVETLQANPEAMLVGASEMYIYFKHIHKMYKFGPYGEKHATAATFAFRRQYLAQSKYEDEAALAEEKHFLKNYTAPLVQLDPKKTILVFSHIHNSFDKRKLLEQPPSSYMSLSDVSVDDFHMGEEDKKFFMETIDDSLQKYEPGDIKYKPEVLEQMKQVIEKKNQTQNNVLKPFLEKIEKYEAKIYLQDTLIQRIIKENLLLKDKIDRLENGKPLEPVITSSTTDEQEENDDAFEAAASFNGSREGKVFKMGKKGLGYYTDIKPNVLNDKEN